VNCLDCAAEAGAARPAVAVCVHCGAAVCRPHAHVTTASPVDLSPLLAASTAPLSRRVHCLTCAASAAGADPGTLLTRPFSAAPGRWTGRRR
jgi:hypothetical protein